MGIRPKASMGPRPFGRGRPSRLNRTLPRHTGFNGAATFRPRKAEEPPDPWTPASALQWGRDLSAAEGLPGPMRRRAQAPASMGPRPFGRGRNCAPCGSYWRRFASMGPRPFGRGRISIWNAHGPSNELQWGRDLSAAEGARGQEHARVVRGASMGPRPFGRGREKKREAFLQIFGMLQWGRDLSAAEGSNSRIIDINDKELQWGRDLSAAEGMTPAVTVGTMGSFNGAATFRPRKASRTNGRHLWLPGFNGAATFRPRKAPPDFTRPESRRQLQWGRDLSAAEGGSRAGGRGLAAGASMGPRPFGRGRRNAGKRQARNGTASMGPRPFGRGRLEAPLYTRSPWGFNGAATFRPRKAPARALSSSTRPCFNGAATFRPRKVAGGPRSARQVALQWGRDLSAAEGGRGSARPCVDLGSFNGAATFRPRKDHPPLMDLGTRAELQWGRDLSAAEGRRGLTPQFSLGGFNGAATFRPRKATAAGNADTRKLASMGPRPFGRGRALHPFNLALKV